ncbi:HK97 family phage prohead protease [Roseobacteraceae bacterium NS-SX3]
MQAHPDLEHKFARFGETLTLQDDAVIAGHASLFGVPDQGGDVVEPGAYATSLAALAGRGERVKMLWQHDPAQPIGVWDEVREDGCGLWVKGRLLTATARGAEAAELIAAGAIDGLSIGYRTKRARRGADGTRHLIEVELWEVSLVTFPMLPAARVVAKAADTAEDALRGLAADLRRAGNLIAGRSNRRQQA